MNAVADVNRSTATSTSAAGCTTSCGALQGEDREMPGLSLTVPQAARLWGLDSGTCAVVLTTLVDRQVLKQPQQVRIFVDRGVSANARESDKAGHAHHLGGRVIVDQTCRAGPSLHEPRNKPKPQEHHDNTGKASNIVRAFS